MNYRILFFVLALPFFLGIAACNKNKPGTLNLKFQVESAGTPITLNTAPNFKLNNGTNFNATLLKFYINNVRLVKDNGEIIAAKNYTLLDFGEGKNTFVMNTVPAGKYKSILFNMGIDYDRNHSGAQDGDLDPSKGMIWTWATGYIFLKHEGQYVNKAGVTENLIYHFGTDKGYVPDISIAMSESIKVRDNVCTANITLDLNTLYNTLDLNVDNNRQSDNVADIPWLNTVRLNFTKAFSLKSVE